MEPVTTTEIVEATTITPASDKLVKLVLGTIAGYFAGQIVEKGLTAGLEWYRNRDNTTINPE